MAKGFSLTSPFRLDIPCAWQPAFSGLGQTGWRLLKNLPQNSVCWLTTNFGLLIVRILIANLLGNSN
jgi:hypothetical protein